jgi:diguanylate cyclase (GGDEF)-like protein/PAS domain S-box-containing protein
MNTKTKTNAEMMKEIYHLNQRIRELEESQRHGDSEALRKSEEHFRAAQQDSEERYRTLVENANDVVFRTDGTGCFTFVNPAALRITGYEEKEIIGRHYPTFIRPDMRDEAMKFFGRQLVQGIQNTYSEYPLLTKEGREVWLGQNTQLITEDGRVIGFQAVSRDITDRKRMEKELSDSEERYRRIIEASNDAVLLRSKESIIYANPAAFKLFRAKHPGDLIGKPYLTLVHPDDLAASIERVKKSMDENWTAPPREHRILALDGQVVQVESTGVPVKYRGETHVFGIFRDITDRKRAEAKLRQQTDAMEAAIDGMALLDEAGKYVYLNRAHAKLYGYENAGELIGESWKTLYDSDILQRFEQEIMPEFGRRGNWHGEAVGTRKDGSKFPQELSLTATADGGLICVVRDITERKQAEEALQESEKRYRELSIVDDLTQLYNSRHFYYQLKIEMDRSNRYGHHLTLLLLDLDNFKAFNDAYGHVEGDQVLWRLGQVVKRCLRETDLAYRYGGEEFTIILPMTTSIDGVVIAERIRTEFKKETFSPAPGQDVHMTVSIGLAQYERQEKIKAFVHRVDQWMYRGKKAGKDRVCCGS